MAKVTLRDVAEAAGVSIATASWAVNDNRDVQITESTRRKVRRAADELGYHHNALARGLARGRSDIIGFISDGVATSPFAGQVIQGAQDEGGNACIGKIPNLYCSVPSTAQQFAKGIGINSQALLRR